MSFLILSMVLALLVRIMPKPSSIVTLASQYNFTASYAYDWAFRQHIANKPYCSWEVPKTLLFNLHVKGQVERHKCYHCSSADHFASRCPAMPSQSYLRQSFSLAIASPPPGPLPVPSSSAVRSGHPQGSFPTPIDPTVQACLANSASISTVVRVLSPTALGSTDASSVGNHTPHHLSHISNCVSLDSVPIASFPPIHVSRLYSLMVTPMTWLLSLCQGSPKGLI